MIKPGSRVYVKAWDWGNDEERPAKVVSVNKQLVAEVYVPHWSGDPVYERFHVTELLEMKMTAHGWVAITDCCKQPLWRCECRRPR